MPSSIVHIATFAEPEELLAALRSSNDALWRELPEHWVYRGHASAAWDLLPTVLRPTSSLTHHPHRPTGPYGSMQAQIGIEGQEVLKFATIANRHGLPIPGGWTTAKHLLSRAPTPAAVFPPFELWDLFALAQHHGVPTRLLDWSRDPRTAAYFAAYGAARLMNQGAIQASDSIGIWALNTATLWHCSSTEERVRIVDPPRHGNINLIAQDGVFTVHTHAWAPDDPPRCESLDATVERIHTVHATVIGGSRMRLLMLPAQKARKLLVRLEAEGVTASRLFPGYDGVVRSMTETLHLSQSSWRAPASED